MLVSIILCQKYQASSKREIGLCEVVRGTIDAVEQKLVNEEEK